MALQRLPLVLAALLLLGFLAAAPAPAEILLEAYRSPFGIPWSVSVNRADSSVWAASGGSVMHLAEDGAVLNQIDDFSLPLSVSVNPTDGSCWVADWISGEVVRLAPDGAELWRVGGFDQPCSVSVNPNDGSGWVAAYGIWSCSSGCFLNSGVFHLSADGVVLSSNYAFSGPLAVSVNPTDNSCWVANTYGDQVVHLASSGAEVWRGGGFTYPCSVSVDPNDSSCWVAAGGYYDFDLDRYVDSAVVHLGPDGGEMWRTTSLDGPDCVAVNPEDSSCWVSESGNVRLVHLTQQGLELCWVQDVAGQLAINSADGSCWVGHEYTAEVIHLSESGSELWRRGGQFIMPWSVATDPTDGSCWVTDPYTGDVVHVAEDGTELDRNTSFLITCAVAVHPTDGSYWATDPCLGEVGRFAADGTPLWTSDDIATPQSVSINPTDNSCWVSDPWSAMVVHFSAGGDRLWTGFNFCGAMEVSVNPTDGSCWTIDCPDSEILRLAATGAETWRSPPIYDAISLAVNPMDGSVWMADWWYDQVIHLAANGTELWRGYDFYGPESVSVNPSDGSCWVADTWNDRVVHPSASGAWLSSVGGFYGPHSVSPNPTDGSCWVTDTGNGQIVRLERWFGDVPLDGWCFDAALACVDAGIVSGYGDGLYHPEWSVTRDQMAVYISRAISAPTGPGSLSEYTPPTTPSFSDVGTGYWAYTYIEYAVANDIVGGYADQTYHPGDTLDRGQMAVFIAHAIVDPYGEDGLVGYQPPDDPTFPDVPNTGYGDDGTEPFWAYKHIEYIAGENVCGGYGDGLYHPEYICARDQMAVYIARAFGLTS